MAAVSLLQKWQLLQDILCDSELTPAAKIVAGRLLHHHNTQTGQCSPSYETLAQSGGIARRSVIRAVTELEEASWLAVDRVSGGAPDAAKGFVTNSFRINFERSREATPVTSMSLPPGNTDVTPPSDTPVTPRVTPASPPGVTPVSPKQEKLETGKGNREECPPTPSWFAEFWGAFPKQEGEDGARREYDRVIREQRATHAQLVEGAIAYAAACQGKDVQYIARPTNWLKDGRWRDRPAPPSESQQPQRRPGSFSALRYAMETMDDE